MDITRIVLTQPAARAGPIARQLEATGLAVQCWPLLEAGPEPDIDWTATFRRVADSQWVVFPSPASIAIVLDAAAAAGLEWPARAAIALVGPGSREELARWHDRVPGLADAACIEPPSGPYDAAALLSHPALQRLDGCRVVALRRVDGSRDWIDALRRRGAQVEDITAYRVHAVDPPAGAAAWMAACRLAGQGLAVSVGSAEAGRRLAQWASHLVEPDGDWLLAQPVLTVHPRIASALEAAGWRWIVQHAPGMAGLLGAVESVRSDTP